MIRFAGRTIRTLIAAAVLAGAVAAAEQPKDPVCGMAVDAAKAVKAEHNGKTYYFCSDSCKREFQKDPQKYVKAQEPAKAPAKKK